jgi:PAS domain S-box-containing protein
MDDTQTQTAFVQELTALRHRLRHLEAVITSLPHAVCVLDIEGRITCCNAAFAQLTGARVEALLRQPATALYGPEAASVFLERRHEAFVGEPVPAFLETALVRTDGTRVPVELAVTDVILEGQRTGCLAVVRDLSAPRQAEDTPRALLRLGQRLHATSEPEPLLASLVEEALALIGAEGGCAGLRTLEGLVCRQYLRPPEVLPLTYCWPPGHGLPGWLLVHKQPYLTNDAATDPQIVPAVREAFGVRSALGTPILDRHGEVLGFFALHNKRGPTGFTPIDQDIAVAVSQVAAVALENALAYPRLQQAEEDVQRAEHLAPLGRLAASVAHEIRNPLQAMGLHVDILAAEVPHLDPNPRALLAASLGQITTQLGRLQEIVDDYLSLARLSALQRTPMDVGPLVEGVASECRSACMARGITLHLEGLSQLGRVAVHPGTFRRALLNLVQNALEAMPQGGVLTLRGRGAGDRVQLEIRDTGHGIPPDQLPRLFAPFHTTKPQGTGLGLYVTREIVAAHGGEIAVHSAPGAGTAVTLTLPAQA